MHDKRFPNESDAYRRARNELLVAEQELRRRTEHVAAMRRALPPGGAVAQDYVFAEGTAADQGQPHPVRLSQLFGDKNTLVVYSFMYSADAKEPCPMCTSFLDGINGSAPHIAERINLVVVAKSPIARITQYARSRGWNNLRLLSSADNTYNADYFGENAKGNQQPALNVFQLTSDGVRHTYNTELLFVQCEPQQHPRHVDALWPVWALFDLTPGGRGETWMPKRSYARPEHKQSERISP